LDAQGHGEAAEEQYGGVEAPDPEIHMVAGRVKPRPVKFMKDREGGEQASEKHDLGH
jgi:hypothetical protein